MRNIHFIHASRGRAAQALQTMQLWIRQLADGDTYTVAVEEDQFNEYCRVFGGNKGHLIVQNSTTAIESYNMAAKSAGYTNADDIIIAVSDDFYCMNDVLDAIREACPSDGVLKTHDGIQNYIVTLPIIGMEWYWKVGFIYPPQYKHMFADTHLTHLAELKKKLVINLDIVIPHHHYSLVGGRDEIHIKNDTTFNEGRLTYLEWARNKDLPTDKNLRNYILSHNL